MSNYRYLVVEYCFKDDSDFGEKHILGSFKTIDIARKEAGKYITENVKRMRKRYRVWTVRVQLERIYFPIR